MRGKKIVRQRDYHVCCIGIEFFSFLDFFSVSISSVSFAFLYGLYEGFLDSILIQCSECIALYNFTVSSVTQFCLTLSDPTHCSTPGFPVLHPLPELAQTHVHQVSDAIQPSHPLSSPSPPAFNLSQHQSLFEWVSSSHQVAKVLEFQLQHQSFQWIFRTDLL